MHPGGAPLHLCAGIAGLAPDRPMLAPPPIEFVTRDGLHLAYQRAGDGPIDLVYVGGATAVSMQWEEPATARGLRRLASFTRLVTYDQEGMGYSDRMDLSRMWAACEFTPPTARR